MKPWPSIQNKGGCSPYVAFFPDAELAVIPDAGHQMSEEDPKARIVAVREYLNTPIQWVWRKRLRI
jgi:pimeloyl-ACP methyl ester carboxylesterase